MDITPDYYLRRSAEIVAECAEYDQEIARIHAKKAVLLAERAGLLLDAISPGAAGYEQAERSMFCEVAAGLRVTQYAAVKLLTHSRTLHPAPCTLHPAPASPGDAGGVRGGEDLCRAHGRDR